MKRFRLAMAVGLAMVFFVTGMAFSQTQGGQSVNQGPPRYGCQQRFNALDANHDGKLTKAEFMAAPHWRNNPEQVFASMDVNGRGYVTKEEFCAGKGMGRGMRKGPGARINQ